MRCKRRKRWSVVWFARDWHCAIPRSRKATLASEGAEMSSLQGFAVTMPVSSLAKSLHSQPPFYWVGLGWLLMDVLKQKPATRYLCCLPRLWSFSFCPSSALLGHSDCQLVPSLLALQCIVFRRWLCFPETIYRARYSLHLVSTPQIR